VTYANEAAARSRYNSSVVKVTRTDGKVTAVELLP
jgi:hypothetical protein